MPANVGYRTSENSPCSACPNSWNRVRTLSRVSRVGSPSAGRAMLSVFSTTGRVPSRCDWVTKRVHPGAAALGVPGVEVGDEQPERPVLVVHVEDAHVGVVAGQVVALGEAQPVEPAGGVEDPVVQHPLQLEVGTQRVGVDVEPGPRGPARRRTRGPRPRSGGRPSAASSAASARALAAATGASLPSTASTASTLPAVPISTTQDAWCGCPSSRARSARRAAIRRTRSRVSLSLPREPRETDARVQPLAQLAVGERGERRLLGGQHQGDQVAVLPAGGGGPGRGGDGVRGQPGQLGRRRRRAPRSRWPRPAAGGRTRCSARTARRSARAAGPARPARAGRRPARRRGAGARAAAATPGPGRARAGAANSASMRANSAASRVIASACAASCGATSASMSRMPGVLHEPTRVKNTAETRRRIAPDRSSATSVFSNVGGCGSAVIASTSARCSAIPAANAGRKCSSRIASKSGNSNGSGLGREERVGHPREHRHAAEVAASLRSRRGRDQPGPSRRRRGG